MDTFEHHSPEPEKVYTEADFDGSRPAPLRLVGKRADQQLIARQDQLILNMSNATKQQLKGIVSDNVIGFVSNGIVSRMHMREALNSTSYNNRLYTLPRPWLVKGYSWSEVLQACEETVQGARTVVQSDIAQRALGMSSIEYRNITMIGELRRELEAPMWDEMSEFLGVDTAPRADQDYHVKLFGFSDDILKSQEVGAMRIEIKREIDGGELDNGTIAKVRTTASINTSIASGFDQNVINSLREQQREAHEQDKKTDLSQNPEFLASVRYLIDSELPAGLVLARNETIYGSNKALEDKIRARNERMRRMKDYLRGNRSLIG